MQEIKAWLETAGEPVADTAFIPGEAEALPYVVFLDTVRRTGGDMKNLMKSHSLIVERYCDTAKDNSALESLFDEKAIKYEKDKQWLSDMECFMTTYTLETEIIEREVF